MIEHPLRAKVADILHGAVGIDIHVDQIIELIRGLNDGNQCDFDCDNCHQGGCGNMACERGGCPEDNAALAEEDRFWAEAAKSGHTVVGCQTCMTSICQLLSPAVTREK